MFILLLFKRRSDTFYNGWYLFWSGQVLKWEIPTQMDASFLESDVIIKMNHTHVSGPGPWLVILSQIKLDSQHRADIGFPQKSIGKV